MRGLRCDGVIVRLTVLLRKAFVAMVNIDGNDGVLWGPIAGKPSSHKSVSTAEPVGAELARDGALKPSIDPKRTNTGTYTQINRPLSTGHSAQGRL
jgi:hypothetical protein